MSGSQPPNEDEDESSRLQVQLASLMAGLHENTERLRQCKEDYETKMAACAQRKAERDGQVEEMRAGLRNLISARAEEGVSRQTSTGSHNLRDGRPAAQANARRACIVP